MQRPALTVGLVLTMVLPQARAQGTPGDSGRGPGIPAPLGFVPFAPPHNPALAPGGRLGLRLPAAFLAGEWERRLRAALPDPSRLKSAPALTQVAGATDTTGLVTPMGERTFQSTLHTGALGPYADIGMQLNVRFELKADQFHNLRCTAAERQQALSGCNPGFPTISPNPQYAIRAAGVVGQRLHVNVDFDSQREFDANNNLQVWYEGLQDEVLRRVEAGNVSFQVPGSRFISAAIPANNFGVQAIAQVGALEMRGIYAQQKGTVVKDRLYLVGETTSQPVDRQARDLDYEAGRFFFAVDPAAVAGFPAVDILTLDPTTLPASLRVVSLHVYRMRAVSPISSSNQNIGGIRAIACGAGVRPISCVGPAAERAGPFQWELLQEGKDYYVDGTGAWFVLTNRLDQSDYLAVSYVAASGVDSVGTFPVTASLDSSRVDTLRLVYDPKPGVTAASPAFRFEIRSAYRVGGNDLTRESVTLALTVNQRERTVGTGETYLQHLGLALATDPTKFDQYNRLFPRTRDPQQGAPLRDLFVVFPHLAPFADSTKLGPTERNDSLYRTPRTLLASQAPPSVFALRFHANALASADRGSLTLNSFQIREGSEKLFVGGSQLTRGVDYNIDYATGQVLFTSPDSLFRGGVAQVRAQFEERSAFAVAPTSIYGLAAAYDLGTTGRVNFTGLFQKQQSAFTRPPLGFEPNASFIGGVSTDLHFQPSWITRALGSIPGVRAEAPSTLNISGELALSKPSPNQAGQAYIEEFESEAGRFIPLADVNWHWGSIPTTTRGVDALGFAGRFDPVNAAFLTWQSLPVNPDSTLVQFLPQQIDPTIVLSGATRSAEPVLWITMKPDTVLGLAYNGPTVSLMGLPNWVRPPVAGPRWRSITQTLSATGIDLSRVEYLEFWVWEDNKRTAKANRTTILFDFGSVFEDALAFVPDSFTLSPQRDTIYHGQRAVGLGRLDTERDRVTHSWNAALNDQGILSDRVTDGIVNERGERIDTLPLCNASINGQLIGYAFGDLRSRCGRGNGAVDTEDQDDDFQLDSLVGAKTNENFVRFAFTVGDDKYYVRDGGMVPVAASQGGGAAGWRLYRIPFRTDTLMEGQPSLRQVQAIRITIAVPATVPLGVPQPQVFFALSRVQLVGSTWLKRSDTPIRGIAGQGGTGLGEVVASVVSTENRDLGYTSPPGVLDQPSRQDAGFALSSTQINERSLRVLATGLARGQHAEAYERFTTEGDKNFLKYRQLRVWARGRGPGWEDGDLQFYIKVGKDENNFYLYHVPARTSSWEPEVVVNFAAWLTLRAQVEQAWLRGDTAQIYPGCPDTSLVPHDSAYVMCAGPYVIHVRDPGSAPPNLAAVGELATGILRVNDHVFINQAELWVDDIRLADVVDDAGMAGALDVSLTASDVADVTMSLSRREAAFRQLGEDPSFSTDNVGAVSATLRLDRLLPAGLGVAMPVSAQVYHSSSAPFYLSGTDVRADSLSNLRSPASVTSVYSISLRRVRRSPQALMRWLVDPVALAASYTTSSAQTSLSTASASSYTLSLDYGIAPNASAVRVVPGFVSALVRMLPRFLRDGAFLRGIDSTRLRINPTSIQFRSVLSGADARQFTYQVPVRVAADAAQRPGLSRGRTWHNQGSIGLGPLPGLQVRVDLASTRDLRDYGDTTTMGLVALRQRRRLLGADVGLETQRTLNTFVSVTPNIGAWIRPRANITSTFTLSRDPNAPDPVRTVGDSAGAFRLPTAFTNSQRVDVGTQVDARKLASGIAGDSAFITRLLSRITNIDLSIGRTRQSSYGRAADAPTFSYQLGLGGLAAFQSQNGTLANSAIENRNLTFASGVSLPLGIRVTGNYTSSNGVTWVFRSDSQVPIHSRTSTWPSGTASWSLSPPRPLSDILTSVSAQLGYRRQFTAADQPSLGVPGPGSQSQTTDRTVTPSLTLSWLRGIITSLTVTHQITDQLSAGNLFRTDRDEQDAFVAFAFRPPPSVVRLKGDIRTNLRYSVSRNATCIRAASGAACVSFVDSRQSQAQLTMDTSFPPSLSAGLQMAYIVNQESQANSKTAQMVITAFVNLSTSVGQFR